ncbi:MAG: acetolactate synthase small subunit [Kiritimatiellaeota bacterium]|nr:acetolactate synthase small subunit [Kiritimatiellota bacterium]
MQPNGKKDGNTHTLSVTVANKPGVLARIAHVFARRGFNIDSLVVSASVEGDFSRMTITATGDPGGLEQIIRQVNKLVDVIHCTDHTGEDIVLKELALIKVHTGPAARAEALQIAAHFGAASVDLTETSMILMATADSEQIDALLALLKKFKIVELVRTGKVVMARGEQPT